MWSFWPQIEGQVRTFGLAIIAYLAGKGILVSEEWTPIFLAGLALVTGIWTAWSNSAKALASAAAAAATPEQVVKAVEQSKGAAATLQGVVEALPGDVRKIEVTSAALAQATPSGKVVQG